MDKVNHLKIFQYYREPLKNLLSLASLYIHILSFHQSKEQSRPIGRLSTVKFNEKHFKYTLNL